MSSQYRGNAPDFGSNLNIAEANSKKNLADSGEQLCNVCQSTILPSDSKICCDECNLPFHVECWEENLGCSAYGCSSVNKLRKGPDIRITSPPTSPVLNRNNISVQKIEGSIPWDYLLLAISALGILCSFMCFGVFSLTIGVGAILYFVISGSSKPSLPLVACMALSAIGFTVGVVVSFWVWF